MVRSRAVKPQTQMLAPPPNTLGVGHPRIVDRADADKQLTNPIAASKEVLEQGRALFDTFCSVCHGADGRKTGPVGQNFRTIADLSTTEVQAYSDGKMYTILREGGMNMPSYAETLTPPERWAVVHLVRTFR
jgi:mono/diheme cytochrome c family protein